MELGRTTINTGDAETPFAHGAQRRFLAGNDLGAAAKKEERAVVAFLVSPLLAIHLRAPQTTRGPSSAAGWPGWSTICACVRALRAHHERRASEEARARVSPSAFFSLFLFLVLERTSRSSRYSRSVKGHEGARRHGGQSKPRDGHPRK